MARNPISDPIGAAARAAADHFTGQCGPGLKTDVEAALHARRSAPRPQQYFDPISLGTLIVSIASLAWTIYTGLKKKTPNPAPDVLARAVRVELRTHSDNALPSQDQITDVVVAEIIRAASDSAG